MNDPGPGLNKTPFQKAMNAFGYAAGRFGKPLPSLDPGELTRKAEKKAGLSAAGIPLPEGLSRLVEGMEKDGRLPATGRMAARNELVHLLANRIAVRDHIGKNPSCAREKIERPIFVTGLPRSGAGLLHRLIMQDETNRPLLSWECRNPHPPITPLSFDSDQRIARFDREVKELYRRIPRYRSVRPIEAGDSADCSALLAMEFTSHDFFLFFNVPSYQSWLEMENAEEAYRAHRVLLQYLQSSAYRGARWLLKSPSHMHNISPLLKIYPDAAVITVHRNPVDALASHASQVTMLRGLYSDEVDPASVGKQQVEWWDDMVLRYLDQRKKHEQKNGLFYDVRYEDLVKDPIKTVESIYGHYGFEFSFELHKRIQHHLNTHPRGRWGAHAYSPGEYGIQPAADRSRFDKYTALFGI